MQNSEVYPYRRPESDQNKRKPKLDLKKFYSTNLNKLKAIWSWDSVFIALISFFMGRALILGELLPFAGAFMGAMAGIWPQRLIVVLAASIYGTSTVVKDYHLASAAGTLILLYLMLPTVKVTERQKWLAFPMEVFACTVIVKTAFTAYFQPAFYNYVVIFFEALLAGILTFLSLKALSVFIKKDKLKSLSVEELVCLVILIAGLLMGISDLTIGDLAVKNIVSDFIILAVALMGGSGIGSAVGTVIGFVPSITTMVSPSIIGVYAFSGMLGGLFRAFGKLGVSIGFLLGTIIFSIYLTDYQNLLIFLGEAGVALAVFFILPKGVLQKHKAILMGKTMTFNVKQPVKQNDGVSGRLKEVASVFNQLGQTFEEVSSGMPAREQDTLQDIFNKISTSACNGCSNYARCWQQDFYNTYQGVLDLFALVEVNGLLTAEKVGGNISKRCVRLKELITVVNCLYETFQLNRYWESRIKESRELVSGQLKGIAKIMEELVLDTKPLASSKIKSPSLTMTCGVARAPKTGSLVCGDSCSYSELDGGQFLLLVSDGMGIGTRAAQESGTTVTLLEKLLYTGFDKHLALKTVNSVLLLRSPEETFATVDMAIIDLNNGEAEFMKIGAVTTFIVSGDKVHYIKGASLPIGILNQVDVESIKYQLFPGDSVVMITDGVLEANSEIPDKETWIAEILKKIPTDDPQRAANLLLLHAKEMTGGLINDDMSVLIAKVEKTEKS